LLVEACPPATGLSVIVNFVYLLPGERKRIGSSKRVNPQRRLNVLRSPSQPSPLAKNARYSPSAIPPTVAVLSRLTYTVTRR